MDQLARLDVVPVRGMPTFHQGMSIARELVSALDAMGEPLGEGDVCVIAQKIVSKAEGGLIRLADVTPSPDAFRIAEETDRIPQVVQLILDQSSELLRATAAAIIARHRSGHVLANAGIDASNVEGGEEETVLVWPKDPDASARAIRAEIAKIAGVRPAVVIADSMGRAWRVGTIGHAIGCAGVPALEDRRGEKDMFGRTLEATIVGVADSLAAAATLAMGEGAEGTPAAIVRGAGRWVTAEDGVGVVDGLRPVEQDMFR